MVLRHRIIVSYEAEAESITSENDLWNGFFAGFAGAVSELVRGKKYAPGPVIPSESDLIPRTRLPPLEATRRSQRTAEILKKDPRSPRNQDPRPSWKPAFAGDYHTAFSRVAE